MALGKAQIKKFKDYEFKQVRVPKFEIRQLV